jgi:hypothetical protein
MRKSERIAEAKLAKQQAGMGDEEGVSENVMKRLSREVERLRRQAGRLAVTKTMVENQIQTEQSEMRKLISAMHVEIWFLEEKMAEYYNRVEEYNGDGVPATKKTMPAQLQNARVESAISEGACFNLCDNETLANPVSPIYLRNGFETLIPYHPASDYEEPQAKSKRKRQEFEESPKAKAPFATNSANFIATEQERRRKKVRRQAPVPLYEQLIAQREHLTRELQLTNERMKATRKNGKFELECLRSIFKEDRKLKEDVMVKTLAAAEKLQAAIIAADGKRRDEPCCMEIDDDASSPESPNSESDSPKLENTKNFSFDYCLERADHAAHKDSHVLFAEYSEENVVDMEF